MTKTTHELGFDPLDRTNAHRLISLTHLARCVGKSPRTISRYIDPTRYEQPLQTIPQPDATELVTWGEYLRFSQQYGRLAKDIKRKSSGLTAPDAAA